MGKPLRVLIVEDSEDDTILVIHEIQRGGYDAIFERVETAETMKAAFEKQTWDVIVVDYTMPQFSVPAALTILKESGLDIPFIIVSGSIGEDIAVAAMKAGVHDYIMKNNLTRLVPAIERELKEAGVRQERKRAEEALRESEERFRSLFANSIDGVLLTSPDGKIFTANAAACRIFGRTEQELCQVGRGGVVDVSDPRLPEALEEQERTGKFKGELTLVRKDGTKFPAEISSALFKDKQGFVRTSMIIRDITERKRAEQALVASEERYRALFEGAAEGILVADIEGKQFKYVNPAICRMLGYTTEELMRLGVADIHPKEALGYVMAEFEAQGRGEKILSPEIPCLRKDGSVIYASITTAPVVIDGRKCNVGFFMDITERKKAEEALRESEDRYRDLVENSQDVICTHDLQGHFLSINPAAVKLLGYDRSTLLSMNVRDILAPNVRDQLSSYLDTIRRDGAAKGLVLVQTATGERRIWEYNNTLRTEGVASPIVRVINRDVTERKQAEQALRESEERFRELYDHAPVGYHEYDIEGRITNVNLTDLEMLGYTCEEMVGRYIWEFTLEEEIVRQQVLEKLAGSRPPGQNLERAYRRKDGTTLPVLVQDRLIRDESGRITGIRCTIQDITERKRTEQEMAALQEQLRQSQKMEAIGRLAGGIVHDFNNLLTIIKGYSQLSLLELKEDSPLKEDIEEINRATDKSADLIRQLLAFSRRQVMEMRVLDLNILLRNLNKMLRRVIGEDIELVTLFAEGLGRVKTDPGQIEQVIFNLAVNARDAMPSGGKLTIETANVELDGAYARRHVAATPGRYVMLAVSDTGVGMTPEVRDRVFEPFFTTKEEGKGTGLGLSTVYGIVKQSEGNIWIYSEPGHGTTFKIYLPQVEELWEEVKEKVVGGELPHGSETVLVVEDEEEVRKLAVRVLKRQGYKVLEASNGADTLMICKEQKESIHLILTDVVMPGMDGCELADRLKSLHPKMRILYMSGYTDNTIVHHGVLEEGIHYIQKPFTMEALAGKVREVLDNKEG